MTSSKGLEQIDQIIKGVLERNRPVLSRTITLIESALPDHQALAREILGRLLPHTGKAVRLGITGVPGVGKSTFIESFGMYLTGKGLRLAPDLRITRTRHPCNRFHPLQRE